MRRLLVLCVLGIWGSGCVSAPKVPDWAGRNWQEKQVWYFSGISSPCRNMACAREEAYNNAAAAVAAYLGSTVSVLTEVSLDGGGQYLTARFSSSSQEVPLRHMKVEQFKVAEYQRHWVGYVLVSVEEKEINAAFEQINRKKEQQAKQLQNRRNLGILVLHAPRFWADLSGAFNRFLTKAGYRTGKQGADLYLQVKNFSCTQSQIQDIQICTLQANVIFRELEHSYIAAGYGRTPEQARREAVAAWIGQIPEDILEEK